MNPATILALITAAIEIGKMAPKWIQDLKGRGELTPEQEAELDAKIADLKNRDHWQIRP